jgi:hypothetical protein
MIFNRISFDGKGSEELERKTYCKGFCRSGHLKTDFVQLINENHMKNLT